MSLSRRSLSSRSPRWSRSSRPRRSRSRSRSSRSRSLRRSSRLSGRGLAFSLGSRSSTPPTGLNSGRSKAAQRGAEGGGVGSPTRAIRGARRGAFRAGLLVGRSEMRAATPLVADSRTARATAARTPDAHAASLAPLRQPVWLSALPARGSAGLPATVRVFALLRSRRTTAAARTGGGGRTLSRGAAGIGQRAQPPPNTTRGRALHRRPSFFFGELGANESSEELPPPRGFGGGRFFEAPLLFGLACWEARRGGGAGTGAQPPRSARAPPPPSPARAPPAPHLPRAWQR